jgi:hypothetical protein
VLLRYREEYFLRRIILIIEKMDAKEFRSRRVFLFSRRTDFARDCFLLPVANGGIGAELFLLILACQECR